MSKRTKTKPLSIPNPLHKNLCPQNWAKAQLVIGVTKEYLVTLVKNAKGRHRFKGRDLKFLHYIPKNHVFKAEPVTRKDYLPEVVVIDEYLLAGDNRIAYNMLVEYATRNEHGLVWDPSDGGWVRLKEAA